MGSIPGRLGALLERHRAVLQVALDFTSLSEAFRLALSLPRLEGVILEAGTPLIKSVGLESVRILRALPGEHLVAADMKTMDTGGLETKLAAQAGADATSVLAAAPRETIVESLEAAGDLGIAVYGDLIGVEDPISGARRLRELGVHIALLHIGIDVQKKLGITASKVPQLVESIAQTFGGPIAVAGGIKPGEAGRLVEAGARIVIIGGAITKARDPKTATLTALRELGVVEQA